ncbi:hypothetical protein [Desulfobotulus mexicanus]|uniref:hypothetical protein n=1 Tax=Desulfobotulus mexicanus TaxID=2586642 RepID=UPI0015D3F967|nr:hypothetical protein [Desulfobotulus mexicanus]
MIELTQLEAMALETFLDVHWPAFQAVASDFLSPEEMDELVRKLEQATEAS